MFEKFWLYLYSKPKFMYSLNCSYFTERFETVDALLSAVLETGTDPNSEILRNGQPTGETAWDLIEPGA